MLCHIKINKHSFEPFISLVFVCRTLASAGSLVKRMDIVLPKSLDFRATFIHSGMEICEEVVVRSDCQLFNEE